MKRRILPISVRWGVTLALASLLVLFAMTCRRGWALFGPVGFAGLAQGVLYVQWWPVPPPHRERMPWQVERLGFHEAGLLWGFRLHGELRSGLVQAPIWALALALGISAAVAWRRHLRRPRAGQCTACGYDLRGLASARCPECGAPFTRPTTGETEHEHGRSP